MPLPSSVKVAIGVLQSVDWPKPPMTDTLCTPDQPGAYLKVTSVAASTSGASIAAVDPDDRYFPAYRSPAFSG